MDPCQPSQQEPKLDMGLSSKDLWKSCLSKGVNPVYIQGRLTEFLWMLYWKKYCHLHWKGQRKMKWKKAVRLPTIYSQEACVKLLSCKHMLRCMKRRDDSQGRAEGPDCGPLGWAGGARSRRIDSQALKPSVICSVILNFPRTSDSSSPFTFSHFERKCV